MNFDRLAAHYDWMETLTAGGRLQRMRTHWLGELAGRKRILSVGEGHGRFAAACLARYPDAELTCVEASPAMLAVARARVGGLAGKVNWVGGDILAWQPDGTYDAIVTCFFLDCFPPETLAAVVAKLAAGAAPDAVWINCDFNVPARGWAHWRARAVHALMYGFFRVVVGLPARRLTPPDAELERQGFERAGRVEADWGLLRAEVWRKAARCAAEMGDGG